MGRGKRGVGVEKVRKDLLNHVKRVVIKVGSGVLTSASGLNMTVIDNLTTEICALKRAGLEVLLVSSGAIASGLKKIGMSKRPQSVSQQQAMAAVGQSSLIMAYEDAFGRHGHKVAQILLTRDDLTHRRRYLNARNTLFTLLSWNIVPIINENDTVATSEIRYGDNDRLAAHVAQMCGADVFVMLSDIDGLYECDPRHAPDAAHIPVVHSINADIFTMAGGPNATRSAGSGGMRTKIEAAKIAVAAGCATIIAKGDIDRPLSALKNGAQATLFPPRATLDKARRAWIAGRLKPMGSIHIDAGAFTALQRGASLLPAGIEKIEGEFEKGDAVAILRPDGMIIGQGLIAYDSRDVTAIIGLQSTEVEAVLGYRRAAAVHRDDLVLKSDL